MRRILTVVWAVVAVLLLLGFLILVLLEIWRDPMVPTFDKYAGAMVDKDPHNYGWTAFWVLVVDAAWVAGGFLFDRLFEVDDDDG